MITVDCRDILPIKSSLAIYASDKVGAVPALKLREFMLAPIDDEDIDPKNVIDAIKNFLLSIGVDKHFAVIQKKNTVSVIAIDDYKIESFGPSSSEQFFSCVHCGHVTRYETVHNNHMKIHYL